LQCNSFNGVDISSYKQNSRIKFLGRVSDEELINYYRNAVCFIFPSLYEGFGIPVIEAQACGCPVISSNSSSLHEVLGESAIMCNSSDIEGFANAMKSIYEDDTLRNTIISKGFENTKRFSWEKSAKKIENLLINI
jgi:glycosyltransferase involved in cell wall biosynthesis